MMQRERKTIICSSSTPDDSRDAPAVLINQLNEANDNISFNPAEKRVPASTKREF
jgi:hypothetical protein